MLEFPFVVQPCQVSKPYSQFPSRGIADEKFEQHIVGSACLHRMIDEGCPRCPICGVRIEIDGDDGEASGGAEESYDSPLSEAPDSPIWPVQQNFAVVDTMDTDTELKTETVMETETETASSTTSGGSRASMPCSNNWQGVETPPTSPPEQRDSPGWIRKGPGHAAIRTSMQVHSKDYCLGPWELEDEQQVQAALALLHMKYSDMWT